MNGYRGDAYDEQEKTKLKDYKYHYKTYYLATDGGHYEFNTDGTYEKYSDVVFIFDPSNGSSTVSGAVGSGFCIAPDRSGSESYLDEAKKFTNVPYLYGGYSKYGIDCSGVVSRATGNNNHNWSTKSGNPPPGKWVRPNVDVSSYKAFKSDVLKGDLFVWPGHHAAFYNGGESLFHAHGKEGTPTGITFDLQNWIINLGYPDVYRQFIIRKD